MKTISVMNVKGGVGKTVTAVNLAEILAGEHGLRVLLIDADAQGDATWMLDETEAQDGACGTYGLLMLGGPWTDHVLPTKYRRLDLISGGSDLFYLADLETAPRTTKTFRDLMESLREDDAYDVVIIDCPPAFSATSVAALASSDLVLIPVKLDALSIRGCEFLVDQVQAMLEHVPDLRWRILATMYRGTDMCRQALELLDRKGLGVNLLETRIRRTDKVDEASFFAQALDEYSRYSAAGRDYRDLAMELLPDLTEGGEHDGL